MGECHLDERLAEAPLRLESGLDDVQHGLGEEAGGARFAYKKNTSDTRQSVAIDVCRFLLAEKATLSVHDPRVSSEAIGITFSGVRGAEELVAVETDPYVACDGAHAILVLTEWDVFTRLDYQRIFNRMERPAFVFDGRNLLDHDLLRSIGFTVFGIGKPLPPSQPPTAHEQEAAARQEAANRARQAGAARPDDLSMGSGASGSSWGALQQLKHGVRHGLGQCEAEIRCAGGARGSVWVDMQRGCRFAVFLCASYVFPSNGSSYEARTPGHVRGVTC